MWERLKELKEEYENLERKLADPALFSDQQEWRKVAKEHSRLQHIISKFQQYQAVAAELQEAKALLKEDIDEETREWVEAEIDRLGSKLATLEDELKLSLIPKDPLDEKNVIVEIRAGTGGEEAALFASDLCRMYTRYAERRGWKTEILDVHPTDMGGVKEVILAVEGEGAYSRLKYESGVHRVQRVPVTESGGRIHTSTATVAVLPEAEEVDVQIDPDDLVIETFRASGPGGQHVNKTESAVRITHVPTGIVVSCQDEKSQHKNRDRAMRVLRARLLQLAREEQQREIAELRRSQVGSGDRSERIRTYNFPQGRVTDHRIGLTIYRLDQVLDGDLEEIINALLLSQQAEQLKTIERV